MKEKNNKNNKVKLRIQFLLKQPQLFPTGKTASKCMEQALIEKLYINFVPDIAIDH